MRVASPAPARSAGPLHASLDDACYRATDGATATLLLVGVDEDRGSERAGADQAWREDVLRAVKAAVRATDLVVPMESGDVAVLLRGAGLVAALGVGDRVLRALGELRVRASLGLASTEEGILEPRELLERAMAALADARQPGGGSGAGEPRSPSVS